MAGRSRFALTVSLLLLPDFAIGEGGLSSTFIVIGAGKQRNEYVGFLRIDGVGKELGDFRLIQLIEFGEDLLSAAPFAVKIESKGEEFGGFFGDALGFLLELGADSCDQRLPIFHGELSQHSRQFTDPLFRARALYPTVIQLKYMAELLGVDISIGGLWHAGSYDPHDFLGRLIGDKPWVRHAEMSMYECYDDNFYATDFHIDLFIDALMDNYDIDLDKAIKVGWPMEYLKDSLVQYKGMQKRNLILFPHRVAPEKQVDIFRDLAERLPQYEFVVCQEQELTKNEYHNLLGEAKMVFSANLQETLGISWYEGALVDAIPMVPDRLSYSEMALPEFLYPSEWTENYDAYTYHRDKVVAQIVNYMENFDDLQVSLEKQRTKLNKEFFSGKLLYETIKQ